VPHGALWLPQVAHTIWVHGGGISTKPGAPYAEEGYFQLISGHDVEFWPSYNESGMRKYTECPAPLCLHPDPLALHIYHYRSPTWEDVLRKRFEYHLRVASEVTPEVEREIAAESAYYEQIRDTALLAYRHVLTKRILGLDWD
jgi:hypothetical protein